MPAGGAAPNRARNQERPLPTGTPHKKSPAVRQGFRGSRNRLLGVVDRRCSLDQGCCGSLPLLKVSSGSQLAQKCWAEKVLKGLGPCGASSAAGVSDWT
jgi:hypothetical protein